MTIGPAEVNPGTYPTPKPSCFKTSAAHPSQSYFLRMLGVVYWVSSFYHFSICVPILCLFACLSFFPVFFFCQLPRFSFAPLRQHISRTGHPYHASNLSSSLQLFCAPIYLLRLTATCQVLTIVVYLCFTRDSSSIPATLPFMSVLIPHTTISGIIFLDTSRLYHLLTRPIATRINPTLYPYHFSKNFYVYPHLTSHLAISTRLSEPYPRHVIPFLICALLFSLQICYK